MTPSLCSGSVAKRCRFETSSSSLARVAWNNRCHLCWIVHYPLSRLPDSGLRMARLTRSDRLGRVHRNSNLKGNQFAISSRVRVIARTMPYRKSCWAPHDEVKIFNASARNCNLASSVIPVLSASEKLTPGRLTVTEPIPSCTKVWCGTTAKR